MSWDKQNLYMSKFNFNFSWRYQGDHEFHSVLGDVFRILESQDERSLEQVLIGCVNQAGPGLILVCPTNDPGLPYEMKFTIHPPQEEFCITQIIILSEARNLELYVNGGYETSSRGIMLTMNKGKKSSLFEAQFNLSSYTDSISNAAIKFLSFPCKSHMEIQAVVLKVEECQAILDDVLGGPVNMPNVKKFLGSIGRPLSDDAQKMLHSIENYQKSPAFKAQQLMTSQNALLQNFEGGNEISRAKKSVKGDDKVHNKDEKDEDTSATTAEEHGTLPNMLGQLGFNDNHNDQTHSSPQSRWAAYLRSRVRAGKLSRSDIPPGVLRSMSAGETLDRGCQDDRGSRQRPNSVGCVASGEADRTFNCDAFPYQAQHSFRCDARGCHGCLSVYNSITTSIFAAEQRILEKVDKKFDEVREDLDEKFDILFQLLDKRKGLKDGTDIV